MYQFDFSPLFRSTIGFDRLGRIAEDALRFDEAAMSYPPCNIETIGEDSYRIMMAVVGFGENELTIETKENALVVAGHKEEKEGEADRYVHRGIAGRDFVRRFQLADYVKVVGASVDNGLLQVDLERELPETMKPRKIEVTRGPSKLMVIDKAKKLIESAKAA